MIALSVSGAVLTCGIVALKPVAAGQADSQDTHGRIRSEVTLVMPRRDFPKFRQRMLHDRTSRRIVKALGRYPHIDITSVPYYFGSHPAPTSGVPAS